MRQLFTALFLMIVCSTYAQKAKLEKANQLFQNLNYSGAVVLYEEILKKADVAEAKVKLADCFRKLNDSKNAEYWYGQTAVLTDTDPINKLYYAMALQANGKCDLAKQWFEQYNTLVPSDQRGIELAKACDKGTQTELMSRGVFYKVKHLANLNTDGDDFSAAFLPQNKGIIFVSDRDKGVAIKRINAWNGRPFVEIFSSQTQVVDEKRKEIKYNTPVKAGKSLNTKFHDGPAVYSQDGSTVFFTRNNLIDGKTGRSTDGIIKLKIFQARVTPSGTWDNIVGLPFNSDEFSVCHPAISPDGTKMIFVSDMPGGYGGMDLYITFKEGQRWIAPVNLGAGLNTEGDEVFPSWHKNGNLYFSSNGHVGLGGLDIFQSKEAKGSWSPPVNLAHPINSNADDFSYVLSNDEAYGYLSSNRAGGLGGDDLYSFIKYYSTCEVLVYNKLNGKPLKNATVTTPLLKSQEFKTDDKGVVKLDLPLDQEVELTANLAEYNPNTIVSSTKGMNIGSKNLVKIPLEPSFVVTVLGKVTDIALGTPLANATVTIESDCGENIKTITTDQDGNYSTVLRPECCYIIKAEKAEYMTNAKSLCTKNISKAEKLKADIQLKSIYDGKAIALENIYYDFGKADLREDASTGLNELYELLKFNKEVLVEIGSHTDSRGTSKMNENLSQRRAQSVVNWLIAKGIPQNTLVARGYGESMLVNNCADGVKCTEEEHQLNRRTEFKLMGKINGKDYQGGFKSTKPVNVKVDPCTHCD